MHLPTTLCLAALFAAPAPALAATLSVSTSGPYTTIQAAVVAASDGDTILIDDGVWSGPGNRNIALYGRVLTIRSDSGQAASCVVDCENGGRFIRIGELESGCVLSDFTIFDGLAEDGGGILITQNASATLDNLHVFSCTATAEGGGVRLEAGASVLIEDCEFIANHADEDGGALLLGSAEADVVGSVFVDNTAGYGGGAVHSRLGVGAPPRLTMAGCTLQDNEAQAGGAVYARDAQLARFEDCTLAQNEATWGGAFAHNTESELIACTFLENHAVWGGAVHSQSGNAHIEACALHANEAVNGGGAIVSVGGTLNMHHTLLADNICTFEGSTFLLVGSVGRVDACRFLRNTGAAALKLLDDSVAECANSLFTGNEGTTQGGAAHVGLDCQLNLVNCTLVHNQSDVPFGAGLYVGTGGLAHVANSVLWANTGLGATDSLAQIGGGGAMFIDASCVQGFEPWHYAGAGNIDADPLLVDPLGPDGLAGTEDDDCRLSPGSPAIDAGDNLLLPADALDLDDDGLDTEPVPFDLDDTDRIKNGTTDMGAYEREATAVPGDLDGSGDVEVTDLVMLITNWGGSGPGADLAAPYDVITVDDLVQLFLLWSS